MAAVTNSAIAAMVNELRSATVMAQKIRALAGGSPASGSDREKIMDKLEDHGYHRIKATGRKEKERCFRTAQAPHLSLLLDIRSSSPPGITVPNGGRPCKPFLGGKWQIYPD